MPGASGSILEVVVPYSRASMAQLLGKVKHTSTRIDRIPPPGHSQIRSCLDTRRTDHLMLQLPLQFTSKQPTEDMALAAFNRALKLSGPGLWVPSLTSS
jgi:hypothetical protein